MAKSLEARLFDAVTNITKLEVITRVGDFKVAFEGEGDPKVDLTGTAMQGGLYTRIDLVDGDTFNNLTADVVDPQRAELQAFHQRAVTEAQAMVKARIELVAEIAKWIAGEAGDLIKQHASKPPPA